MGNDAWSGRIPEPNRQKTDGPFRSFRRAQLESRKESGARTVTIRGGTYYLPDGLVFEEIDSGTQAAPAVWQAYGTERPLLYGGLSIADWKLWKSGIYAAALDSGRFGTNPVTQLLCDGTRQPLARYPNLDSADERYSGWAYVDGTRVPKEPTRPEDREDQFRVKLQDWRSWKAPDEVQVVIFPRTNYWNDTLRIKSRDLESHTVVTEPASFAIRPGDRYYFQGAVEDLDSPGEWYFDQAACKLYFYPRTSIAGSNLVVPTARNIIRFQPGTHDVVLKGISFCGSIGTGIALLQSSRCKLIGLTVSAVGGPSGAGIIVDGGETNSVIGCDVSFTGANGVSLSGGDWKSLKAAGHVVDNCVIHDTGFYAKQSSGIRLEGVGQRAAHCLIYDLPRMGIVYDGNNHAIEFNHIHHVGLETEDLGAVYSGGRDWISARGSVVRYNYIHDVVGFGWDGQQWRKGYLSWGIYLDDNTSGVDVYSNIVAKCARGSLHAHNARDCRVSNNIFLNAGQYQWEFTGWTTIQPLWCKQIDVMQQNYELMVKEPAWQGMRGLNVAPKSAADESNRLMSGNAFFRNLLVWTGAGANAVRSVAFDSSRNYVDYNLYWGGSNSLVVATPQKSSPLSWDAWKAMGFDVNSTNQDPRLARSSLGDCTLPPNSPISSLGFRRIPFEQIGPYESPDRPGWIPLEQSLTDLAR